MKSRLISILSLTILSVISSCKEKRGEKNPVEKASKETGFQRTKIIFDTDANNELDDQFAIAYMLFNGDVFDVKGITVNATKNDKNIQGHYDEAERIMQICNLKGAVPLLKGAEADFQQIATDFDPADYDGQAGVDFILNETKKDSVTVVAVGKLTNIALALKKDPSFAKRTKIVWLGSNYPKPGEYNQDNDTIAMNYVLNSTIPFEMVTVRYGQPSGTDAVAVTQSEINEKLPDLGPTATEPITGRHGGTFDTFGDYGIDLFEHIFEHIGTTKVTRSRPLFDMVALAIIKNPDWAKTKRIPCPILINNQWVERPENSRKIRIWQNFKKRPILDDFYETLKDPVPINE